MFINILQYARGEQIMYRAIVVDDESIIRNGISSFINSCDAGFEVVGTFPDGKDAIDFLHDNEVELIITDIKMVNVSGIELAQYIYENIPSAKVILLSGYAEFEYAKAAITYNVKEYITKPTNFSDLKNTLLKLRDEITEDKKCNINEFFDNIKQLYAAVLACNHDKAHTVFKFLLDSHTHSNEYLGQYAFNIFQTIIDHLYANLKIQLAPDTLDYKQLPSITDYNEINTLSDRLLDSIIKQFETKDKKTDDIVISKLIQFINENFSENISLQDAADKVFFAPAYCSRFFKEHTGENFSDYLLKVRMRHAAKLLRENKKITDISKECGYRSFGYFTRVFKEYYKCTPSEYKRDL